VGGDGGQPGGGRRVAGGNGWIAGVGDGQLGSGAQMADDGGQPGCGVWAAGQWAAGRRRVGSRATAMGRSAVERRWATGGGVWAAGRRRWVGGGGRQLWESAG
jgi:hypothetical protein